MQGPVYNVYHVRYYNLVVFPWLGSTQRESSVVILWITDLLTYYLLFDKCYKKIKGFIILL